MQFVESFNMKSFYVSAKTGDNVSTCFHKVAADLAGITLTKPEVFFLIIFLLQHLFPQSCRTLLKSPSLSQRFFIFFNNFLLETKNCRTCFRAWRCMWDKTKKNQVKKKFLRLPGAEHQLVFFHNKSDFCFFRDTFSYVQTHTLHKTTWCWKTK